MTNCVFYALFFTLFLNISFGSLKYSQINRSFMSVYKGMLEASVVSIDIHGEPTIPYYDGKKVVEYSESYLSKNIAKYTKDYTIDITFYDKETGYLCEQSCRKVKINLKAKINYFFSYDQSQTFIIKSEDEL